MNIGITSGSGARIAVRKTTGNVHYNRLSNKIEMRSIDFPISGWTTGGPIPQHGELMYRMTPAVAAATNPLVDRNGGGIRVIHARLSSKDAFYFNGALVVVANDVISRAANSPATFITGTNESFTPEDIEKIQGSINFHSISSSYLPNVTDGYLLWEMHSTNFLQSQTANIDSINIDYGYNQKNRFPFFCKSSSRNLYFRLFFYNPRSGANNELINEDKATLTLFYQQVYK